MISTVAVGTDGSSTASDAVEAAAEMARRYDAKLVLLSAFQATDGAPRNLSGSSREIQWSFSPVARLTEQLERTEAEIRAGGIECDTLIEEGDLTLRIGPSADGVVLGAHAMAEAIAEANRLLAQY